MSAKSPRLPVHSSLLTERQQEVLRLIARGRTNFEIATELGITLETAKYHVTEILTRLEVSSREEAADIWRADHRPASRLRALIPSFGAHLGYAAAGVGGVAVAGVLAIVLAGGGLRAKSDESPGQASAQSSTIPPTSSAFMTVPIRSVGSLDPTPPEATLTATVPRGTIAPVTTPAPSTGTQGTSIALTPTPASGPYPAGTRTGIPAIDRVLAAVESGSSDTLAAAISWFPSPCFRRDSGPVPTPGSLMCPGDVPSGTFLEVTSFEATDGGRVSRADIQAKSPVDYLAGRVPTDSRVYAIVDLQGEPDQGDNWVYRIVFASGEALVTDESGLVFFPCLCQRTPAEQLRTSINQSTLTYILPPRP